MISQTTTQSVTVASTKSQLTQNIAAGLFGLVVLFMVGLAPLAVAHNAAHDVRHNVAFPCH